MPKTRYTVVDHNVRENFDLTLTEYCIADSICKLSNQRPWCLMSQDDLAKFVGISKRYVNKIIDKLVKLELIEQNFKGKVKITKKWIDAVELINGEQSSPQQDSTGNKVHRNGEQSSPRTDNNTNLSEDRLCETNSLTLPINDKKLKMKVSWSQSKELTDYLSSKTKFGLDGGGNDKFVVRHLMNALVKQFPTENWVKKAKEIIDIGYQDPFHSKNLTSFRYLYNHWVKILKNHQDSRPKVQQRSPDVMDLNFDERVKRSKSCKLGCVEGMQPYFREINGHKIPAGRVPCDCSKDLF